MKWLSLLLLSCMLCSCMRASEVDDAIDGLNTSVAALEASLPKECKTTGIDLQISGIKKQILSVENTCNAVVEKERTDKTKWKMFSITLLLFIGFYVSRKIIFVSP